MKNSRRKRRICLWVGFQNPTHENRFKSLEFFLFISDKKKLAVCEKTNKNCAKWIKIVLVLTN